MGIYSRSSNSHVSMLNCDRLMYPDMARLRLLSIHGSSRFGQSHQCMSKCLSLKGAVLEVCTNCQVLGVHYIPLYSRWQHGQCAPAPRAVLEAKVDLAYLLDEGVKIFFFSYLLQFLPISTFLTVDCCGLHQLASGHCCLTLNSLGAGGLRV